MRAFGNIRHHRLPNVRLIFTRHQTRHFAATCHRSDVEEWPSPGPKSIVDGRAFAVLRDQLYPYSSEPEDFSGSSSLDIWTSRLEDLSSRARSGEHDPSDDDAASNSDLQIIDKHFAWQATKILVQSHTLTGFHLLSHLGVDLGKWDLVSQVVRIISQQRFRGHHETSVYLEGVLGMRSFPSMSIEDLITTNAHAPEVYRIEKPRTTGPIQPISAFEPATAGSRWESEEMSVHKAGIGLIWRNLADMIINAQDTTNVKHSQLKMDHVLDLLAILHHNDVLPDRTYWFRERIESASLAQPPLISMLSNHILKAILDAQWNMFQGEYLEEHLKFTSPAQQPISGLEFSENNNPKKILPYSHSIWLELVLWACLHGGWILDGATILRQILGSGNMTKWRARTWSDMISTPDQPCLIEKGSISSELIAAYIDTLFRWVDIGVGRRGHDGAFVLSTIQCLEHLLQQSKAVVTHQSWLRSKVDFNESSYGLLEADTEKLRIAFNDLASPLRTRDSQMERKSKTGSSHNIAGIPLGDRESTRDIWYRALRNAIQKGSELDIEQILTAMQHPQYLGTGNSNMALLPREIILSLIDRVASTGAGPVLQKMMGANQEGLTSWIPTDVIKAPSIAPKLIRFAIKTNNHSLLEDLLRLHTDRPMTQKEYPIIVTLCQCQIEEHNWTGVQRTINGLEITWSTPYWYGIILASLARELLYLSKHSNQTQELESQDSDYSQALDVFKSLLARDLQTRQRTDQTWPRREVQSQKQFIVGILSSIDSELADMVRPFLKTDTERDKSSRIPTQAGLIFEIIQDGVVGAQPLQHIVDLWKLWCPSHNPLSEEFWFTHSGEPLPNYWPQTTAEVKLDNAVEITLDDGEHVRFWPKIEVSDALIRGLKKTIDSDQGFQELISQRFSRGEGVTLPKSGILKMYLARNKPTSGDDQAA